MLMAWRFVVGWRAADRSSPRCRHRALGTTVVLHFHSMSMPFRGRIALTSVRTGRKVAAVAAGLIDVCEAFPLGGGTQVVSRRRSAGLAALPW